MVAQHHDDVKQSTRRTRTGGRNAPSTGKPFIHREVQRSPSGSPISSKKTSMRPRPSRPLDMCFKWAQRWRRRSVCLSALWISVHRSKRRSWRKVWAEGKNQKPHTRARPAAYVYAIPPPSASAVAHEGASRTAPARWCMTASLRDFRGGRASSNSSTSPRGSPPGLASLGTTSAWHSSDTVAVQPPPRPTRGTEPAYWPAALDVCTPECERVALLSRPTECVAGRVICDLPRSRGASASAGLFSSSFVHL